MGRVHTDENPTDRAAQALRSEAAIVWRVGSKRYFTKRAAQRAVAKAAIEDFCRGTGDELSGEAHYELMSSLMPKVKAGLSVTADDVHRHFDPDHETTPTRSPNHGE